MSVTGSEDVGLLATAAGVPCVYWYLGGSDPALFTGVTTIEEARDIVSGLPSNHSPFFAPVVEPTLRTGITALTTQPPAPTSRREAHGGDASRGPGR